MSFSGGHPSLMLAPSVKTEVVTTTTVTTTTYSPIVLPRLPPPFIPKDAKEYPLLRARLPPSLSEFTMTFPDGARATFKDTEDGLVDGVVPRVREVNAGEGWRLLDPEELAKSEEVKLAEAIDRFNKGHSVAGEHMQGVEGSKISPQYQSQPRRKPRGNDIQLRTPTGSRTNIAAPPSPLPSPTGSPGPHVWDNPAVNDVVPMNTPPTGPLQPDLQLATLLSLPNLLNNYASLPPKLQTHVLLSFLRHSPLSVLRSVHSVLDPALSRDFLTELPAELVSIVLSYLPWPTLAICTRVCKSWRHIIDSDPILWRELLKTSRCWFGGHRENAFARTLQKRRAVEDERLRHHGLQVPERPHPFKTLFKSRQLTRTQWQANPEPNRVTFPAHGSSVVTCLLFSHGRIISASEDHSIRVYNPLTGTLVRSLEGHSGGVWALAATKNTLVSGSTDRTVRIWDLVSGECTHVFGGHKSTVRCLAIVKPEIISSTNEDGLLEQERWPKRALIVTGSRDHTLRVWKLPKSHEPKYQFIQEEENDPTEFVDQNPYHQRLLAGHSHAVRALAAQGRTLVSGSYDCTVRVWDIIDGNCRWVLQGHTQKVYSIVLDAVRNQACSGSMDSSVRIWNLATGQCVHVLTGHASLVGLLGLSQSFLVSAAADSTLRVWDPTSGDLVHTLVAHTGAITCFQHDEFKILSGSDGTLKMWDIRTGNNVRDLLTGITGVWQVVFDGRWCVAASNQHDATYLNVWDFGHGVVGDGDEEWVGEGSVDGESGPSEAAEDVSERDISEGSVVHMEQDHEDDAESVTMTTQPAQGLNHVHIEEDIPDADPEAELQRRQAVEAMKFRPFGAQAPFNSTNALDMGSNPHLPSTSQHNTPQAIEGTSPPAPPSGIEWSMFGSMGQPSTAQGIDGLGVANWATSPQARPSRRGVPQGNQAGPSSGASGSGPSNRLLASLPGHNDETPSRPRTKRSGK